MNPKVQSTVQGARAWCSVFIAVTVSGRPAAVPGMHVPAQPLPWLSGNIRSRHCPTAIFSSFCSYIRLKRTHRALQVGPQPSGPSLPALSLTVMLHAAVSP